MRSILVCYEQVFGGEILEDSYVRYIDNDDEIIEIEQALYDDPHVTCVWFKEVEK